MQERSSWHLVKRFATYYGGHKQLLWLDICTSIVRAIIAVSIPFFVTQMLRHQLPAGDMLGLMMMLGLLVILAAGLATCSYITSRWGHVLGARMETDMRADIFSHLQRLSFRYFDNTKTGHIMSRISNDLAMMGELSHHAPEDILLSVLMIVGAMIVMFFYSPVLAIITLLPIPLMVFWGSIHRVRVKSGFREVRKRIADINSGVENSIQGIREVQSFTNEKREICRFDDVNSEFLYAKERVYGTMASFNAGIMFMRQTHTLIVIGGGALLIRAGVIDLPILVGALLYVRFIMQPINRLISFVEQFIQGITCFERFTEVMDEEPDIVNKPHAKRLENVRGDISFTNLSFRYNEQDAWVLKNINMEIPAGKTVALVGASGAGKTTLASLLPRFYQPTEGTITIDGQDVTDLKKRSVRRRIGIVQQNVFLFDTTLRENILFGRPDASEPELIDAVRRANIHDFINSLPNGLDTMVGEHGVKLSGGQKQRVSIARVFLKQPRILIFDEATSSLDNESERWIQGAMSDLSKGLTTIIIAHRLSTVEHADCIYVLNDGQIIEQGRHKELIDADGFYCDLYKQRKANDSGFIADA
jgi:ATP-binding cassette subfamily B protein